MFIEVTKADGGKKFMININSINTVDIMGNGYDYAIIETNTFSIPVMESYKEVKEMIKRFEK